jgi:hypothetical protein
MKYSYPNEVATGATGESGVSFMNINGRPPIPSLMGRGWLLIQA